MCEYIKKKEYCDGVIATLETGIKSFQALLEVIKLEERFCSYQWFSTNSKCNIAWELSTKNKDFGNWNEMENFVEDLEEAENVDFTLLTHLVKERKLTCIQVCNP